MIKIYLSYILVLMIGFVSAQEPGSDIEIGNFQTDTIENIISLSDTLFTAIDSTVIDTAGSPFLEDLIDYNAKDSMVFSLDGQKVFLHKEARITYQDIILTADFIELNLETKEVYAEGVKDTAGVLQGNPVFNEGGDEYESKTLRYNFQTGKGIITEVRTQQEDGYIHSQRTKKISDDIFILKNGKYTTCDAEHPHFYLHLTRAKVIKDKKIVTGPAYMVLEDFPIYFPILPFAYVPNKTEYSSGILIPSYGEEANRGFFLRDGGFYWAANDFFDLAVTGDIYSKGSWATKMHTNYKLLYKFSGSFDFSYNVNVYGEKSLNNYRRTPQFRIAWTHSQDAKANPTQNFTASVNLSTSGYEKENSTANTVENYLQSQKSSSISYSKRWENTPFNMSVNLRHSQNSRDSTISLSLPEMTLSMSKFYPFKSKKRSGPVKWYEKFGFNYSANIRNSISNIKEKELFNTSFATDWQNGVKHNIPISLPNFNLLKYINFSPGISYNEKWYFKSYEYSYNENIGSYEVDTIRGFNRIFDYSYSLSASTNIYGTFQPLNSNSRIKGIRHKMTPSISFSYRPDFGKEKFGYWVPVQVDSTGAIEYMDRYNGGVFGGSPGRGASGSISFSLSNNIEMKVLDLKDTTQTENSTKKVKILENLSLNTSYNLIADSLNLSPINIRGRTTIKDVNINFGGILDPYMMDSIGNKVTKVHEYTWNNRKGLAKLGRLTRANLSFGMSFRSKNKSNTTGGQAQPQGSDSGAAGEIPTTLTNEQQGYTNFELPWDFRFDYNFNYSRINPFEKGTVSQTVSMSGKVEITPKWNLSVMSNYDISAGEFSLTRFNLTRDLHCWNMSFSFVPFGYLKSYSFTLRALSGMLSDLKIDKHRSHYDNF